MDIDTIGGGFNGLCCAWQLAKQDHQVQPYQRYTLMNGTSRASSKLLHVGRMNDQALGWWVAEQARQVGVNIADHTAVAVLTQDGQVITADRASHRHDRPVNVVGPWAERLLQASALDSRSPLQTGLPT